MCPIEDNPPAEDERSTEDKFSTKDEPSIEDEFSTEDRFVESCPPWPPISCLSSKESARMSSHSVSEATASGVTKRSAALVRIMRVLSCSSLRSTRKYSTNLCAATPPPIMTSNFLSAMRFINHAFYQPDILSARRFIGHATNLACRAGDGRAMGSARLERAHAPA